MTKHNIKPCTPTATHYIIKMATSSVITFYDMELKLAVQMEF
jgi:hypothetical protein